MDTKQLITGSPKEGFYPIVQDTVTVIELNEAVINLTSESSSEDIIAAFDSVEDFTTLLQNVRNTENIVNGVLINNSSLIGKFSCNILAHSTEEILYIDGVFTDQYFNTTITNTDGTFSCVKNVVYLNREVGDKTNVLILSLENDLANGQKDSPVTAEVSAALKDAISTGKACVIKSANSDILANLQQTGDNVTIIMEQISRVGQTFVAVNTTITVNTATNVISDYQTGAIVLETEGDGSKFLSDDGSYKEATSSVVIPVDLKLNDTSSIGAGYDFSQIYNAYISGKTVYLKDSLNKLYLVINATNESVAYYVMKSSIDKPNLYWFRNIHYGSSIGTMYEIDTIGDVLTKDNTTEFTPTTDYNPATKKYVDDKVNIPIINAEISDTDDDITGNYILNIPNNNTQVYLVNLGVLGYVPLVGYYVSIDKVFYYRYSGYLKREDGTGNKMNNALYYVTINGTDLHIELKQLILTESEYSALGTTPETDDVLYFVIPD